MHTQVRYTTPVSNTAALGSRVLTQADHEFMEESATVKWAPPINKRTKKKPQKKKKEASDKKKVSGQRGDDNAMRAKKTAKVRAHTHTHTHIHTFSYVLMCLMVLCISVVFSGIPFKATAVEVNDLDAVELNDIRKLINNAHSRAYQLGKKEAYERGENKARYFNIFEFYVCSDLKFSCCLWLSYVSSGFTMS